MGSLGLGLELGLLRTFSSAEPSTDEFISNVELLSGFEGSDESTNVLDEGPDSRVFTVVGGAQLDTAQAKFGGSSLLLNSDGGNGDFVHVPHSSDFSLHGGLNVTAEAFIRVLEFAKIRTILSKRPSSNASEYTWQIDTLGTISLTFFAAGIARLSIVSVNPLTPEVWHHVAFTRVGNLARLFVNGTLVGSDTQDTLPAENTRPLIIGRTEANTARDFTGWIDEFRFTQGVARYTENFTVPSSAFPRS